MNEKVFENMRKHNYNLSKYACKDEEAIRIKKIEDQDIRPPFFRDVDKILYSLSYIRYNDKTQVFSKNNNDMISKRMTHVQLVSKIARTIGRALNLNEDLIEAAGLGHDLGHVPFGHTGEKILNEISLRNNEGYFNHNVQSVRILMNLENFGKGNNITIQVLDAILCHNGEILNSKYYPIPKTTDEFLSEYNESYKNADILQRIHPMTLEGCVVRISDIIAYIGKDIEDAIRLNMITENDIPIEIRQILGSTNSEIVNSIVLDIINNSIDKDYICISDKIYNCINELIQFNYKNIYKKANTLQDILNYTEMFETLFNYYMSSLEKKDYTCDIYSVYLKEMSVEYNENTTLARKVIDFIAGMTDDYFINQFNKYCKQTENYKKEKTKL